MKLLLSNTEISHLKDVLHLDLKVRVRSIRLCGSNDELLNERIEKYIHTQDMIEKVELADQLEDIELQSGNDSFNDDEMFRDDERG